MSPPSSWIEVLRARRGADQTDSVSTPVTRYIAQKFRPPGARGNRTTRSCCGSSGSPSQRARRASLRLRHGPIGLTTSHRARYSAAPAGVPDADQTSIAAQRRRGRDAPRASVLRHSVVASDGTARPGPRRSSRRASASPGRSADTLGRAADRRLDRRCRPSAAPRRSCSSSTRRGFSNGINDTL